MRESFDFFIDIPAGQASRYKQLARHYATMLSEHEKIIANEKDITNNGSHTFPAVGSKAKHFRGQARSHCEYWQYFRVRYLLILRVLTALRPTVQLWVVHTACLSKYFGVRYCGNCSCLQYYGVLQAVMHTGIIPYRKYRSTVSAYRYRKKGYGIGTIPIPKYRYRDTVFRYLPSRQ